MNFSDNLSPHLFHSGFRPSVATVFLVSLCRNNAAKSSHEKVFANLVRLFPYASFAEPLTTTV